MATANCQAMITVGLVGLLVLAFAAEGQAQVDCTDTANTNHTLCKYRGPNTRCNLVKTQIDRVQQLFIIANHNYYRSRIASGKETQGMPGPQPAAKDMRELRWDQKLADVANRWASQCKIGSDQLRNLEEYGYVGQNVYGYIESLSSVNWNDPDSPANNPCGKAVTAWYNQVTKFNKSSVDSYNYDPNTGQYSHLAWSQTTHVGCAATAWIANGKLNAVCVCNYGPGGNRRGGKVYVSATTEDDVCGECGTDTPCDNSSLCVTPNQGQTAASIQRTSSRNQVITG